jgi:N-ethylmaleimide reductase
MSDSDPATTFGYVAERLGRLGLAYLHVVEGTESETGEDFFRETRPAVDFHRLREIYGGTYIANGGLDRERALRAIEAGEADLIAFGRPFLPTLTCPSVWRLRPP